ncbi:MAG TPA: enoyl-CoA hydratase-related protein [Phenylobacterium sp.]|uniref:enoyl-CoA hydratase/isomerase family protein n=1 Tax=Phenylobacterium sp. TaxID=1871053 RepID=UPI002B49D8A3|nr:enoyl-CoA hydratase-related protein [Phenylobacterium sp.]HKR87468.1 enoyl-CoA hydratase-related protein [Phenylobacterium sp.]
MSTSQSAYDYSRYEALRLDKKDGVMTITLSNPGRRNATNPTMSAELTRIWEDVWLDPEVRVIVLQGDGADFCAGADASRLGGRFDVANPVFPMTRLAKKHAYAILDCEKPTIAKVRGAAYGVGVTLALACDLVYAAPGAKFRDSHVRVGLVAGDGGVLLWPALGALRRAKEALMLGDPISAEDAAEIGLINRVIPDEELDGYVDGVVQRLLAQPPHALNYTKASLNVALKQMTGAAFETSIAYEAYTFKTEDFTEATRAHVEKRKPTFRGK